MAKRRGSGRAEGEDQEDRKRITGDRLKQLLNIFQYVTPYKWYFIGGLGFLVISTGMTFVFLGVIQEVFGLVSNSMDPESLKKLSEELAKDPEWKDKFWNLGFIIGGVLISQAIASFFRITLFAEVTQRSMADIRNDVYKKLVSLGVPFFEKRRIGELTSRITADIAQLESTIQVSIAEFLRQIFTLIGGLIYLFIISPFLTFVMLGTFPVAIIIAMLVGRYIRKVSKKAQDELAAANVVVEETLHSIRNVKSFVNELFEVVKFRKHMDEVVVYGIKAARARALFAVVLIVAVFGGITVVMLTGAYLVGEGTDLQLDDMFTFLLVTVFIGGSIAGLGDLYGQLQKSIGASERVWNILGEKPEAEVVEIAETDQIQLTGDIQFEEVRFTYPTREDIEVLRGINIEVAAGSKIALAGHSGAGKSTIAQLLLRFYDVNAGQLLIDGKPIDSYELRRFRQQVGVVPQEVMLFGGSIRENIAYGRIGASDEEIIQAAQQANAWEFIQSFPEGLDTLVGDRGVKLSGGQKQRIAIARAILKDPTILILDEATSSLDAESEHLVQSALNKLMEGRTTVIIAHRLSTIRNVDCIYVLDEGQIIEAGTHQELAGREDGAYNNLLRLQLEGE
ncbi:MAG: ABC transporter transmembrane domain-containing protein [Bacteroidota bacterium]